jgi:hypothetical protein
MNGGRIMWSSCCHCRPKTDAFETLSGCSEPKPCPNGNYEVHRNRVLDMRTLHLNSGGTTKGFPPQPGRIYSQIHPAVDLLRVRRSQRAGLSLRSSRRGLMFVHFGSEADTSSLDKIALSAWGVTVSVEHLST